MPGNEGLPCRYILLWFAILWEVVAHGWSDLPVVFIEILLVLQLLVVGVDIFIQLFLKFIVIVKSIIIKLLVLGQVLIIKRIIIPHLPQYFLLYNSIIIVGVSVKLVFFLPHFRYLMAVGVVPLVIKQLRLVARFKGEIGFLFHSLQIGQPWVQLLGYVGEFVLGGEVVIVEGTGRSVEPSVAVGLWLFIFEGVVVGASSYLFLRAEGPVVSEFAFLQNICGDELVVDTLLTQHDEGVQQMFPLRFI